MKIQDYAKLIRQTPTTIKKNIKNGYIKATLLPKEHGGYRWEIDDEYIKSLIGKK